MWHFDIERPLAATIHRFVSVVHVQTSFMCPPQQICIYYKFRLTEFKCHGVYVILEIARTLHHNSIALITIIAAQHTAELLSKFMKVIFFIGFFFSAFGRI